MGDGVPTLLSLSTKMLGRAKQRKHCTLRYAFQVKNLIK